MMVFIDLCKSADSFREGLADQLKGWSRVHLPKSTKGWAALMDARRIKGPSMESRSRTCNHIGAISHVAVFDRAILVLRDGLCRRNAVCIAAFRMETNIPSSGTPLSPSGTRADPSLPLSLSIVYSSTYLAKSERLSFGAHQNEGNRVGMPEESTTEEEHEGCQSAWVKAFQDGAKRWRLTERRLWGNPGVCSRRVDTPCAGLRGRVLVDCEVWEGRTFVSI